MATNDDYSSFATPAARCFKRCPLLKFDGAVEALLSLSECPPGRPDLARYIPDANDIKTFLKYADNELHKIKRRPELIALIAQFHLTDDDLKALLSHKLEHPYPLYRWLNGWLTGDRRDLMVIDHVGPLFTLLYRAMEKLPQITKAAARGVVVGPSLRATYDNYKIIFAGGEQINFWGFSSFSTDDEVIKSFYGGKGEDGLVYHGPAITGVDMEPFKPEGMKSEAEVLPLCPALFRVTGSVLVEKKVVVTVEQLPHKTNAYVEPINNTEPAILPLQIAHRGGASQPPVLQKSLSIKQQHSDPSSQPTPNLSVPTQSAMQQLSYVQLIGLVQSFEDVPPELVQWLETHRINGVKICLEATWMALNQETSVKKFEIDALRTQLITLKEKDIVSRVQAKQCEESLLVQNIIRDLRNKVKYPATKCATLLLSTGQTYRDGALYVIRTAQQGADTATGYWALGRALGKDEKAMVGEIEYTDKELYTSALKHDPTNSGAWFNLGVILSTNETVVVAGKQYSNKDCYINALQHDTTNSRAWFNLGVILPTKETVVVAGKQYSNKDCYINALQHDNTNSFAWFNLGCNLETKETVVVAGKQYSNKDCFINSLQHDTTNSRVWSNLGNVLAANERVTVAGTRFSKKDCYSNALQYNAANSDAWFNLGFTLAANETVAVAGQRYSKKDCYSNAVQHAATNSDAWFNLGVILAANETVLVAGKKYYRRDCYVSALQHNETYSRAWYNLGALLGSNETVMVRGERRSMKDCYTFAVQHDPTHNSAWFNLGNALGANETLTVAGKVYSKKGCYRTALQVDDRCSDTWFNLGVTLGNSERTTVAGKQYSKKDCYIAALQHNATYSKAWYNLGVMLDRHEVAVVAGRSVSAKECYIAAVRHNAEYKSAWNNLGWVLGPNETAWVGETPYSKEDCLWKGK